MKSATLLTDLVNITKDNIKRAEQFSDCSDEQLNYKINTESWSILECFEHLNRYGDFYMPELAARIDSAAQSNESEFKSGWLGNYFVNMIRPKENLNKMKTFTSMNPEGSNLNKKVLDTFLNQQNLTLELLEKAQNVDLTKIKTNISISKWIKLRLGDTFMFVIYHNQRHILQAENVLKMIK